MKLVGCCWLTCSPQTSDSGNSVALYPNARWIAMGGDGAPGRGKKEISMLHQDQPRLFWSFEKTDVVFATLIR